MDFQEDWRINKKIHFKSRSCSTLSQGIEEESQFETTDIDSFDFYCWKYEIVAD